ncbi:MAG: NADP-dependent 3-hydroxy acid dehydrogenase YdfG [Candidatus Moanabacter tarae]|uniref:NADP-dependent 3-hydroxy acid dehydrogenase YdfG n=1 Tax=Candidatus Moanibacter tarae TaxID=2200854 RepID=A0A2Z4AFA7_9BACT|nr:MAG: NADP-dependent 3-hydroxy acid dehydrogenase YdfG [Candidatus Moanabacter tarae]|tara:strand:- start:25928 stop:26668 length:741 start_codon:yes stop_codon:yes gene_type:complete
MALGEYSTALVTGASSGIGEATVRSLSHRGLTVHAVARRQPRLVKLAKDTGCCAHVLDLRDTDRLYQELSQLEVDVLINNAGLGRGFERLFEANPHDIDATLQTNVIAAFHVLRALLPGMVARKYGHIFNISSTGALYPIGSSVYGASKGAIHRLSQNLRLELKGTGVRMTEICPGRTRTEFFEVAIDDPTTRKKIKDSGISDLQPDDIANAIIYALDAPPRVNVNLIELQPTEQVFGGMSFHPVS